MSFGKPVRPLITLGALGVVTALALSGCSGGSAETGGSGTDAKVSRVTVTLTNDGQIEVEVEFVTETDSEDPWVSNPPVRKSLVLVVDPAQGMVVGQLDMTPRGGL